MRKPLKERENGSKITQDPKNVEYLELGFITYKPGTTINVKINFEIAISKKITIDIKFLENYLKDKAYNYFKYLEIIS